MSIEDKSFRDKIATVDEEGRRNWVYPKKPSGKLYNYRKLVAYFLIILFVIAPFLTVNGNPLFLFNVIERRFVIFGVLFRTHDFHLFVLAMLTVVLFIVLFTAVFGRLWCGWACPQTIFMEMVFRRIEYWIEGDAQAQKMLNNSPLSFEKAWKKTFKTLIFIIISSLVAHLFMTYLMGKEKLLLFLEEGPSAHMGTFVASIVFTFIFYGVFAYLREQACTLICPYGRLQGAMLDNNTKVIAFDYKRGEPRAPYKKEEDRPAVGKGSCINCHSCVSVCPTGIDIKNGTQLECVNCTACIDACNAVMDRTHQPRGLIRWASENEIENGTSFRFTPRLMFYSFILASLVIVLTSLLASRPDIEAIVLKVPGTLYQEMDNEHISNLYNFKVVNKNSKEFHIDFEPSVGELKVLSGQQEITGENIQGMFILVIPKEDLKPNSTTVAIKIMADGKEMQEIHTNFMGPSKFE